MSSTEEATTLVPDEITKAVDRMLVEVGQFEQLWKDTVDVDGSKLMLERAVMMQLQHPDEFYSSERSNGLLLYGPSGSGKTTLVKSLVRESGCRMLEVIQGGLLSKWQGDTEKSVSCAVCSVAAYISAGSSKPSSTRQRQSRHASSSWTTLTLY